MAEPDSEHVVDEAAVDKEVIFESVEDHVLVQGVKDSGPRRCRRSPHRCTSFLFEPTISEAKNIISHHQFQCGYESRRIVVFPTPAIVEEELLDEAKGWRCWYVRVHRNRVARKQACVCWDFECTELTF